MVEDPEVFLVPMGWPSKGVRAKLCRKGHRKLRKHKATLGYSSALETSGRSRTGRTIRAAKRRPYILARYHDEDHRWPRRPALGRWLLELPLHSRVPVAHLNGDTLDFRLNNLVPRETEKQIKRHENAKARKALAAERRAARARGRARNRTA
jgi:hypothetical protein